MKNRILISAIVAMAMASTAGAAATLLGEAQKMGEGTIRSYVEVDAGGHPSAIGIILS
jgi:hypothetical protein